MLAKAIEVDLVTLSFLAGTVIPLLTGLVVKAKASAGVKSVVNLALSIATGVILAFQTHEGSLTWQEMTTAAVAVYLASGVSYQNLWTKVKIGNESVAAKVQNIAPSVGLGTEVKPEPPVVPFATGQTTWSGAGLQAQGALAPADLTTEVEQVGEGIVCVLYPLKVSDAE